MDTVEFTFENRDEIMEILNTSGKLVKYLTGQNSVCPLMGSKIKLGEKLGEGLYGSVYLITIEGMDEKNYVVKKQNIEVSETKMETPKSINEIWTGLGEQDLFSKEDLVKLNGGDPDRKLTELRYPWINQCLVEDPKGMTTKRNDKSGEKDYYPPGSYICENSVYSEYVIGMLCADLYRKYISINFIDVFSFTSCFDGEEPANYMIMEKIDYTLNEEKDRFDTNIIESIYIQVVHAIATYQHYFNIQHNDLHGGNIFLEYIEEDTMFNNERLSDADYFHYQIGETNLYIPYSPVIVKVGDFGSSVKYSAPVCGDKYYIDFNPEASAPNWYCKASDVVLPTVILFRNSDMIKNVLSWMLGVDNEVEFSKVFSDVWDDEDGRPTMTFLSQADHVTPFNILSHPVLMEQFLVKPADGKIVTIGTL